MAPPPNYCSNLLVHFYVLEIRKKLLTVAWNDCDQQKASACSFLCGQRSQTQLPHGNERDAGYSEPENGWSDGESSLVRRIVPEVYTAYSQIPLFPTAKIRRNWRMHVGRAGISGQVNMSLMMVAALKRTRSSPGYEGSG